VHLVKILSLIGIAPSIAKKQEQGFKIERKSPDENLIFF
jgi:hypothetical protein